MPFHWRFEPIPRWRARKFIISHENRDHILNAEPLVRLPFENVSSTFSIAKKLGGENQENLENHEELKTLGGAEMGENSKISPNVQNIDPHGANQADFIAKKLITPQKSLAMETEKDLVEI